MPWLQFGTFPLILNPAVFIAAGLVVWFAGVRLSSYADAISVRTRLSQAFLGIALLGVATSLAEVATTYHGLLVTGIFCSDFWNAAIARCLGWVSIHWQF